MSHDDSCLYETRSPSKALPTFSSTTLSLFNYPLFSNMDDIPSSYIFVALIITTFLFNESRSCIKACLAERLDIPEEYFRYDRLRRPNEVRLLRLHAGAPWERLDCDIIQCLKEELPHYQAISYTWGHKTQSHLVWANNRPLRIPANAHEVLHRLRRRKTTAT
jgi:hypothetical protein